MYPTPATCTPPATNPPPPGYYLQTRTAKQPAGVCKLYDDSLHKTLRRRQQKLSTWTSKWPPGGQTCVMLLTLQTSLPEPFKGTVRTMHPRPFLKAALTALYTPPPPRLFSSHFCIRI